MEVSTDSPATLSAEQVRELEAARVRMRRIRRASGVAAMSGWSMAIFAGLTLIGAFFGSVSALVLGLGLSVIAWNELRGGRLLRELDLRGPRVLGWNQLVLGALIVAYAAWSFAGSMATPALEALGGSTGDANMDAMVAELATTITISLYATMAVVGIVVPGLTAWYYFSRACSIRDLHTNTPQWVVQTLRLAA